MKVLNVYAENIELNRVHLNIELEGMKEAFELGKKLEELKGSDADIKAEKHKEKRSLNANSYFFVLCGKLADVLGSSKDEVHNLMLARYGQYERDKAGNIIFVLAPASVNYEKESEIHLKPTGRSEDRNGETYYWYAQMKPSHEYDTQQMAKLIDGTISECKELDIETLSEDEIKRMEMAYGNPQDVHEKDN